MRRVGWLIALAMAASTSCDETPHPRPAAEPSPPSESSAVSPATAVSSPHDAGPPVTIPYWADRELHIDGRAFDRSRPSWILFRAPTTVLAWAYPDTSPKRWWVVRGSKERLRLDPLPTAPEPQQPVLSADGRLVAWVDNLRDTWSVGRRRYLVDYRVNLFDVRRDRLVGRYLRTQAVTVTVKCCELLGRLSATGVTNDGRVALSTWGVGQEVWRPGSDPVRLDRRLDIEGVPMWPPGIGYTPKPRNKETYPAAFARVGPQGRVHSLGWLRWSSGQWNSRGTLFAFTDYDTDAVGVTRFVNGRRRSTILDLPSPYGSRWGFVGWEDDVRIVVTRTDFLQHEPVMEFARCDAITGTCQHVSDRWIGIDAALPY